MASPSTYHHFRTPRHEPQTLADERSHHGGSESTTSPQGSCGSHHSTTRYRSTAATSDRSWFRRFGTICARCSQRLHRKALRQWLALGSGSCLGATAWSGHLVAIAFSLFIFVLLGQVKSRTSALALMVGYYA